MKDHIHNSLADWWLPGFYWWILHFLPVFQQFVSFHTIKRDFGLSLFMFTKLFDAKLKNNLTTDWVIQGWHQNHSNKFYRCMNLWVENTTLTKTNSYNCYVSNKPDWLLTYRSKRKSLGRGSKNWLENMVRELRRILTEDRFSEKCQHDVETQNEKTTAKSMRTKNEWQLSPWAKQLSQDHPDRLL